MAFSSETGQIYIFDTTSNVLTSTYTSHAMTVRTLSWSADSQVRRLKVATLKGNNQRYYSSSSPARTTNTWCYMMSECRSPGSQARALSRHSSAIPLGCSARRYHQTDV